MSRFFLWSFDLSERQIMQMRTSASVRGICVAVHSRSDVKEAFAHLGAVDRYETAQALVRLFDVLRQLLPRRRRAWETTNDRMGIFNAAAVVLTHFQRDAQTFLDALES